LKCTYSTKNTATPFEVCFHNKFRLPSMVFTFKWLDYHQIINKPVNVQTTYLLQQMIQQYILLCLYKYLFQWHF